MVKQIRSNYNKLYRRKALFLRIQLFITILVVVPMIILSYSLIIRTEKVLVNNFSENNLQLLHQTSISLDLIFDNIIDISKQIYNDKKLKVVIKQDFTDKLSEVEYLRDKVYQIANSNSYIDEVYLYLNDQKKVISSSRGYEDASEYDDEAFFNWFNNDPMNLVLVNTHPIKQSIYQKEYFNVLSVYARIPLDSINNFSGAVMIHIKQSQISESVINALSLNEDEKLYVLDNKNNVIFSQDEADIYKASSEYPFLDYEMDAQRGYFISSKDGDSFLTVYSKISSKNITLVSVYSFTDVRESINTIQKVVFGVSLLLIFASIIVSSTFTYRSTSLLGRLVGLVQDGHDIANKSNYNMGKSIKAIVTNVIAYNKVVEERLKLMMPVYKEKFLYNLIVKGNYSEKEIKKRMSEFSLTMPLDSLILMVIEIDDYDEICLDEDYNDNIVKFSITNYIENSFKNASTQALSVETEQNRIAVVVHMSNEGIIRLENICNRILTTINEELGVQISIVIHDSQGSMASLREDYKNCIECIKYKYIFGENTVMLTSAVDIRKEKDDIFEYPSQKIEFLKNYIRAGEKINAYSIIALGHLTRGEV